MALTQGIELRLETNFKAILSSLILSGKAMPSPMRATSPGSAVGESTLASMGILL